MRSSKNYKIVQLETDLWAIEDIKSSENSVCYLLCGKDKALMFDTGLGLSPVLPLIRKVTKMPIVAYLSHWHFDHTGGAHEFKNIIGWTSDQMQSARKSGIGTEVIRSQVDQIFWDSIGMDALQTKSFPSIQLIDEEKDVDIGGYRLKILHTPGHTKDSICLYEPNKKWLFSGDTAYPGPIYLQFEDSSIKNFRVTTKRLLALRIEEIFPGHNAIRVPQNLLTEISKAIKQRNYKSQLYPELRFKI